MIVDLNETLHSSSIITEVLITGDDIYRNENFISFSKKKSCNQFAY